MSSLVRLAVLAIAWVLLAFGSACAEPQGSAVRVELVSWSIDEAVEEPASSGGIDRVLRVRGRAALRMTTGGEPVEVIVADVNLVSDGTGWVAEAEVEALEGSWPATVRAGGEAARTIGYEATIPLPHGPPACGAGLAVSELTLNVYLLSDSQHASGMGATSEPLPIPGREDLGPSDWGFEGVTLTPTLFTVLSVEDLAFAPAGPVWMVLRDPYTHLPSVVEVYKDSAVILWSGSAPQADLGVTAFGPVLTTRSEGLVIEQLSASTPWARRVTGAGGAGSTHASAERVVVAYPAHAGALLDGAVLAEPTQDMTVIFELAAASGTLGRVALVPGEPGPVIGLSDGGVALAQPGPEGNEIVLLSASLEERFRVAVPGALPFALEQGPAGQIVFLGDDLGRYVGKVSASGLLEWTVETPMASGPGASFAPLTGGGVLLASGGSLTEIDAAGTLVRTEEVACDAGLWIQGAQGAAHLAGLVGLSVAIDGTWRELELGNYYLLRAARP